MWYKENIELPNYRGFDISDVKKLLEDNNLDSYFLDDFADININWFWKISFDEKKQAILSKEFYFKLYWKLPKKWSDTNLTYMYWGKLYLNKNYKSFKYAILNIESNNKSNIDEIQRSNEYETALLLDKIYRDLTDLKYWIDVNKQQEIENKILNLEKKSIEYSNIFQLKIKILQEILKDFKWITWRDLDKKGVIDFEYWFNLFSDDLNKPFEKIDTNNTSVLLVNKYCEDSYPNMDLSLLHDMFIKDINSKIEYILKNNINTEVVFLDYQLSKESLDKIWETIRKNNKHNIKIVFSAWENNEENNRITNIGWLYASTMVLSDSNMTKKLAKDIYNWFIDNDVRSKWVITKYVSNSSKLFTVSNTINLLANPKNLLKKIPRKYDKISNLYYLDVKNRKNNINILKDIEINSIPDTKVILIWSEKSWKTWSQKDIFTSHIDWSDIPWTVLLAESIINNDLNNQDK